ncbi:sec-independent protein translocase protein TATA, chloroplastic-like [Canna indica]|uniref:Sec-independent protein translocase protein TATA, chloroplastic-like n=1 Tax=Canna indica TaxID=4628 RepID=A0AAQ3KFZ7_9LILI|nr:sec-independent protein translocase protein TATA, chloroplastic-like [Canna indica]
MAAIAFSSSSLMATSACLPTKSSSLASSNSLFFTASDGRVALTRTSTLAIAPRPRPLPLRRRGCRCLFGLGVPEVAVIAGVAALVFGPKKLPEIGRGFGKTIKSFQQAAKEFEIELKKGAEDSSELPPAETPKAISSEDEAKELEKLGAKDGSL